MLRYVRSAAIVIVMTLVMAEMTLQVASFFVRNRATDQWRPNSSFRILSVGDSHTHGGGVPADESYPRQLEKLLDEREPGVYSVMNLGVPGLNTAQVRDRLPRHVARTEPDLVIVWCGINDQWNLRDQVTAWGEWVVWLDGAATRLRLYKLIRVWLHDRNLEKDFGELRERPTVLRKGKGGTAIDWGDVIEHMPRKEKTERKQDLAGMKGRVLANYEAMARWAGAAGVPLVFITYPVEWSGFAVANEAMRNVGERFEVAAIIESLPSVERLPMEKRQFRWAMHPNGHMYEEIARDIVPVVTAMHRQP